FLNLGERSFSPDGGLLVGGVLGVESHCVWDTASGAVVATLREWPHYHWASDGRGLIGYGWRDDRGSIVACWEVTRPVPSYGLGTPVESLALNRAGDRLAVNDFVCAVAGGERGPELVGWDASLQGLSPHFVGKDELWALRRTHRDEVRPGVLVQE